MNHQTDPSIFNKLLLQWQPHRQITSPPSEPILLWNSEGCHIFIDTEWGPPIPYPPIDHRDGHQNHGYEDLKGKTNVVDLVPEVEGWPELEQFLVSVNGLDSPLESAGCEKHYFPAEVNNQSVTMLGCYVDVIFTDAPLNDKPENLLLLASCLAGAVAGCEQWWGSVEISLNRFKHIAGANLPWGLMIRVCNHGRTEEEARQFWGETLRRLNNAIASLPRSFQWVE